MGNEINKITSALDRFSPISLEEMDKVRLMNRTDTKYIFPTERLPELLQEASGTYRILSINEKRIFRYNSLYYDTAGLKSYFDHHNRIRPRYKVRFREYEDSGTFFLEVKRKHTNERTGKSRIKTEGIEVVLSKRSKEFISKKSPFDPDLMEPALWTIFRRLTLVGEVVPERITIDVDIRFRGAKAEEKELPFLTIAEVKRDQSRGFTDFMQILKKAGIRRGSSSKYCLGTILLKSPIKYNHFKPTLLKLNKIENANRSFATTD
jgi:hypothetical protein